MTRHPHLRLGNRAQLPADEPMGGLIGATAAGNSPALGALAGSPGRLTRPTQLLAPGYGFLDGKQAKWG
ncbi:hypothetical protein O4220_22280 [Rhodococcus ruber]|uniref:Uncharacterized protein n=1 Tax=Rhodococcus ruber TaxID=1830 RepID=A0ABT4MND1_9NOCA|nr:hypothetical protein [Rhodococcus ruber]MCZ4521251.1 hypothetical protein [Rhodococcus ruber]